MSRGAFGQRPALRRFSLTFEIGDDGTFLLPRREANSTHRFRVEAHRGPSSTEVAVWAQDRRPLGAATRPARELADAFDRGAAVLEPLLLAAVRALVEGRSFDEASRRPVRVEPAPGILVVPLRTPTLPPATHTNCILVGDRDVDIVVDHNNRVERTPGRLERFDGEECFIRRPKIQDDGRQRLGVPGGAFRAIWAIRLPMAPPQMLCPVMLSRASHVVFDRSDEWNTGFEFGEKARLADQALQRSREIHRIPWLE